MTRNMKDSGVEWIGEIPEDWSIKKLKFVANIKSGEGITNNELSENGEFEVFGGNGVMGRCNKYNVECSRLIIGRVGALCGNVRYVTQKAYVSDNALILDLKDREIYKFYYYLLHGANLGRLNTSNAQPLITGTKVLNLYIPNINMKSQFKIAAFLDKKCTKIDQTIEKEKQVIEKLKEYKQSVITEAVTKGLNPDAPMKDSGVEWIGEIPEQWQCVKLKLKVNTTKGYAFKTDIFQEKGIPLIKASDIKNRTVVKSNVFIKSEFKELNSNVELSTNDILISTVGSTPEVINSAVGQIALVPKELNKSLLNQNVVKIVPNDDVYYLYLFYFLSTHSFRKYLDLIAHGTANQASLTLKDMLEYMITLPTMSKQKEIADYLDEKCSSIDKLISDKEKVIKKLTEYKKSLIYECVTGKREV
ncbi:TPA: restriction endonuclease subunit S [Clostridium botulinum]|nr:restriction endonuclease subunit S [Clostridium botulinum]HBJ1653155.1 restriction endonuclease subunit S [Clostridium botulinum]